MMPQEEYNRLAIDFAHCVGTHCEKAGKGMYYTAHTMLAANRYGTYPAVITDKQPCPFFEPDRKECFACGILSIYDNVRAADLRHTRPK